MLPVMMRLYSPFGSHPRPPQCGQGYVGGTIIPCGAMLFGFAIPTPLRRYALPARMPRQYIRAALVKLGVPAIGGNALAARTLFYARYAPVKAPIRNAAQHLNALPLRGRYAIAEKPRPTRMRLVIPAYAYNRQASVAIARAANTRAGWASGRVVIDFVIAHSLMPPLRGVAHPCDACPEWFAHSFP